MKELAIVWLRAFVIVTCTALNVTNVSRGHYGLAFLSGGCLSLVWWSNARTAARSDLPHAAWAYALGAACGTVTGMMLGRLVG